MRRIVSAVLLAAAVGVMAPAPANASGQHAATTTAPRRVRVYDPYRRDYHNWTADEERAYREYLAARHRTYVSYQRQRAAERRAYWRWRHEREERLEHERR
jgi:hypothetical protein